MAQITLIKSIGLILNNIRWQIFNQTHHSTIKSFALKGTYNQILEDHLDSHQQFCRIIRNNITFIIRKRRMTRCTVLKQTKFTMVLPYIKGSLTLLNINSTFRSGQERSTKNDLAAGIFSHIRNHKIYTHIKITKGYEKERFANWRKY